MPKWRRAISYFVITHVMRAVYFFGGFLWIRKKGAVASPKEAPILVGAPHSSYYDALPIFLSNGASPIARGETHDEPLTGLVVEMMQALFVSRNSRDSRKSTIRAIQDRVNNILNTDEQWPQIFVYPEGTCGNRSGLLGFKNGAFNPGVPVQPVLLRYPNKLDSTTWTYDGPNLKTLLWLTCSQFTTRLEIEYLPVYIPNDEEKLDPTLFANNVRQVMANALGIPVTSYAYEDALAMVKLDVNALVTKLKGISSFRKSSSVSHILEMREMRNIVRGTTKEIMVSKGTFAADLQLGPLDPTIIDLLVTFLQKKDELFDEREYLVYACLLNPYFRVDHNIRIFFMMYTRGRREMTYEEFTQFFTSIFQLPEAEILKDFTIGHPSITINDKLDLGTFSGKVQKRLEYIKLLGLEVLGYLREYPPRDNEINNAAGGYTNLRRKSD